MLSRVLTLKAQARRTRQAGASLIEVLVALVILMIGLLGLVGLMVQSQRAQLESYQRVQALLLVQDLASRITANKSVATCYQIANLSAGSTTVPATCTVAGATTDQKNRVVQDLTEWGNLLLGSAEEIGGSKVGAVLGARGCIVREGATDIYQVSVAWQGTVASGAPPSGIACGEGAYGSDDAFRRAVSIKVQLAKLS
jgi:type IV pilus assembly protein PilV